MKSRIVAFLFALAAFMLLPQLAHAQIGGYFQGSGDNPVGPTVSPYINLLNNTNPNISNYQSLVKPLINQNNAIQGQRNQLQQLQRQVNAPSGVAGPQTGHATQFMNYSHFYPPARR